jgi:predicted RNA methylase
MQSDGRSGRRESILALRAFAGVDLRRNPSVRAAAAGLVTAALCRLAGLQPSAARGVGVTATILRRAMLHDRRRIEREAQCAADMALVTSWLGEGTPRLAGWTVLPDFAALIGDQIHQGVNQVVELGSGTSTLLIAARLRWNGGGCVVSFEHDARFAERTRAALERLGLTDHARLVVAPIRRQHIESADVHWYDRDIVERHASEGTDLVIVDGPPGRVGRRWPAMPVLYPCLADEATVVLDDGRRRAETRAAFAWHAGYAELELTWHDTVRGAWLLRKVRSSRHDAGLVAALRGLARTLNPHPPLTVPR